MLPLFREFSLEARNFLFDLGQSESVGIEIRGFHFFGEFLGVVGPEKSESGEVDIIHAGVLESVVGVEGVRLGIEVGIGEAVLQQLVGAFFVELFGSVETILEFDVFEVSEGSKGVLSGHFLVISGERDIFLRREVLSGLDQILGEIFERFFIIELQVVLGIHFVIYIVVAGDEHGALGMKTPNEFVHGDFVVAEAVVDDVADEDEFVVAGLEGGFGDDLVELGGDIRIFLKLDEGIVSSLIIGEGGFRFGIHNLGEELEFGFLELHVTAVDGGEDGAAHTAIGIADDLGAVADIPRFGDSGREDMLEEGSEQGASRVRARQRLPLPEVRGSDEAILECYFVYCSMQNKLLFCILCISKE